MVAGNVVATIERVEYGTEPEYFVTDMRTEPAGAGNVRVFAYCVRQNRLHLLYTAVVPITALLVMGRQCLAAGSDVYNLELWQAELAH